MRYSTKSRDWISTKGYGFLSFAENMIKNLRSKYCQKLSNQTTQSATDALKIASKKQIQKAAETTGDLICNKIANRIIKVSKNYKQNNSETVTNEHNHSHNGNGNMVWKVVWVKHYLRLDLSSIRY